MCTSLSKGGGGGGGWVLEYVLVKMDMSRFLENHTVKVPIS